MVVESFLLRGAAEIVAQPGGDHRGRAGRIAVVQEQRAGGNAHDAKNAVERLREHALNLSAHKTRSCQVQVGQCQHVALNTPFFFFIEGHHHQHGDE